MRQALGAGRGGGMSSSVHCRLWNVTHCGCMCAKSLQSCLALSDPMDCNLPASSVHGILQAKILEWVSMPSSRGSSRPRDQTHISYFSYTGRDFPGGSDGKESACDAGDLGLIPGLGRYLEKRMATHSSILASRTPWTEEPGRQATVPGVTKTWT